MTWVNNMYYIHKIYIILNFQRTYTQNNNPSTPLFYIFCALARKKSESTFTILQKSVVAEISPENITVVYL